MENKKHPTLGQEIGAAYKESIVSYRKKYTKNEADMSHPRSNSDASEGSDSKLESYKKKCQNGLDGLIKYGFGSSDPASMLRFGLRLGDCSNFKKLLSISPIRTQQDLWVLELLNEINGNLIIGEKSFTFDFFSSYLKTLYNVYIKTFTIYIFI